MPEMCPPESAPARRIRERSQLRWRIHVAGSTSAVVCGGLYTLYKILNWTDADQAARAALYGAWPWVSVTYVPVEVIAVVGGVLLFIAWMRHRRHSSELVDVETKLQRELQSRFADLFRFSSEAVFLLDEHGTILEANQQAERLYGFSHGELTAMNVEALRSPDVRANVASDMEYCREHGNLRRETVHVRRDGSTFPVEYSATAIHVNGRLLYQDIVRNIEDQKRAEERIQHANEQMTQLVAQLELRNYQNGVLSELRGFLLACTAVGEIGPVLARSLSTLLPNLQGAVFLLSPSRTDLELAARWGDYPDSFEESLFAPDACWGLRRGMPHMVDRAQGGLVCPHLHAAHAGSYACLPLMARGEVLGLLHIRGCAAQHAQDDGHSMMAVRELASTVAEVLSLSIWNIRLRETLSDQAIRDPLTSLYNRTFMEEALRRELYRAGRCGSPVGLIMVDVDRFKRFNDAYGHEAGDLVLSELATLLKWRIRRGDVVCRYGGEEFVLILPESPVDETADRARQIQDGIRGLRLSYGGHELGTVTVSMGIAEYPEHGAKPLDLIRAVDSAVYQAKQDGRDRIVLFDRQRHNISSEAPAA